ncbi:MAG: ATP-binding protein [Rhodospirillales bacterium]
MFKKILVANRGEIACRVIKTARRMGVKTAAVFSDADAAAPHVGMADEAVRIGPPPSAESYLNIEAVLAAVQQTGAEAVHPGYGFLSENPKFAEALEKSGAAFIGPKAHAMKAMGDKIESKKLAEKTGVNIIPGWPEAVRDAAEAEKRAHDIGYPVMLKASAGGGGKGMRIARNGKEAREGFERAANEARTSFGDDRVFIEKFIEQPRHIEIQVLADAHGNTVYLGERECSIQRRHQKVFEESPSPFLDEKTRAAMGEQAVQLARAVDYVSAGTVEFIVDAERNFYFLEMNTRLQVEHPVTEIVTGLDLVELMIRIAAGEPLAFAQQDVKMEGWAVEARLYAENPARGFLPSTGRLSRYAPPAEQNADPWTEPGARAESPVTRPVVRVDSGVTEGSEVSIYYDPMIAKLVTGGATREAALDGLAAALDGFLIEGVETNAAFLSALAAHPRVRSGAISTNLIAEEFPEGFTAGPAPGGTAGGNAGGNAGGDAGEAAHVFTAAAAVMHYVYQDRAARISGQTPGMARRAAEAWTVLRGDDHIPVEIRPDKKGAEGGFNVTGPWGEARVRTNWRPGNRFFRADIDGAPVTLRAARAEGAAYWLAQGPWREELYVLRPETAELMRRMPVKQPPDTSKLLLSPMPGLLVSLAVAEGQKVQAGDELAVVEAMKMENVLRAERGAVVAAVKCAPGESLKVDQVILEFA